MLVHLIELGFLYILLLNMHHILIVHKLGWLSDLKQFMNICFNYDHIIKGILTYDVLAYAILLNADKPLVWLESYIIIIWNKCMKSAMHAYTFNYFFYVL